MSNKNLSPTRERTTLKRQVWETLKLSTALGIFAGLYTALYKNEDPKALMSFWPVILICTSAVILIVIREAWREVEWHYERLRLPRPYGADHWFWTTMDQGFRVLIIASVMAMITIIGVGVYNDHIANGDTTPKLDFGYTGYAGLYAIVSISIAIYIVWNGIREFRDD